MSSDPKHLAPSGSHSQPAGRVNARLKRRWPRRALIAANVLVLLCLVAAASAYGYVRHVINQIAVGPSPHVIGPGDYTSGTVPQSQRREKDGMQAENILLIGNETRQGLTPQEQREFGSSLTYSGTLADIIMILHLDPVNETASILSIPRDLFSPMPTGSPVGPYQKIDAALNDGAEGPDNLVAAIEQDYGIPINGYIELNFNGLINSVNALGGIYVYFPDPVWDAESLLNITSAGCKHLDGFEALALVRARHLQYDPPGDDEPKSDWPYDPESDLARIVRTHTFMKIVADRAIKEGKTNPITAASFLDAISKQITVNQALKNQLLSLVAYYHNVNPALAKETTLSTSGVPDSYYYGGYEIGDVLFPVQPDDNNVIRAWDPEAFPKDVAPRSVSVVSLTGSYYAAADAGEALASHGLKVASESVGEEPGSPTETLVLYHAKQVAMALDVMKYLSGAVMMEESSAVPAGTVQVDLGSLVTVSAKEVPTTTTSSAVATTTAPTTVPTTVPTTATTTASTTTASTAHPAVTTTTVPTPDGVVSASSDQEEPWDPRACPS